MLDLLLGTGLMSGFVVLMAGAMALGRGGRSGGWMDTDWAATTMALLCTTMIAFSVLLLAKFSIEAAGLWRWLSVPVVLAGFVLLGIAITAIGRALGQAGTPAALALMEGGRRDGGAPRRPSGPSRPSRPGRKAA